MEQLTLSQKQEFVHVLKNKQSLENSILNPVSRFESSLPLFKNYITQIHMDNSQQAQKIKSDIETFLEKEDMPFRYKTALTYAHINHIPFNDTQWHLESQKKGIDLKTIKQDFEEQKVFITKNIDLNKDMTLQNLKTAFQESQSYFLNTQNTFIERQNLLNSVANLSGTNTDVFASIQSSKDLSNKLTQALNQETNVKLTSPKTN